MTETQQTEMDAMRHASKKMDGTAHLEPARRFVETGLQLALKFVTLELSVSVRNLAEASLKAGSVKKQSTQPMYVS